MASGCLVRLEPSKGEEDKLLPSDPDWTHEIRLMITFRLFKISATDLRFNDPERFPMP
jgi:hypothetical protein